MGCKTALTVCAMLLAGAIEVRGGSGGGNGSGPHPVPPPPKQTDTTPLPASLKLSAELIGADGVVPEGLAVSPTGLHFAYIAHQGSRSVAVIDGKTGPAFDSLDHITQLSTQMFVFSPDGKRCGYLAHTSDGLKVVVGEEQCPCLQIQDFMFSPDGSHYAFAMIAVDHEPWLEAFDGKPQTIVTGPKDACFSPDGKHFAYWGELKEPNKEANNSALVMDGKAGPRFAVIREFTFSSNSAHYAYIGDENLDVSKPPVPIKTSHLIVDGVERANLPTMSRLILSPDGAHVAVFGGTQGLRTAWLDGKTWDFTNDSTNPLPAVMSPDGSKLAYLQNKNGGREAVSVNGKKGLDYDNVDDLHFSSDGHLYYQASMINNGGHFVIRDEEEFGPYMPAPNNPGMGFMGGLVFSPDGKHVAYIAGDGKHAFVVADGKKGADYDYLEPLLYSPDSQRLAYLARRAVANTLSPIEHQQYMEKPGHDTGHYLVVDDKPLMLGDSDFQPQTIPHFSPDSKHILYLGSVDGQPLKPAPPRDYYHSIAYGAPMFFSPDSKHLIYQQSGQNHGLTDVVIDGDHVPNYYLLNIALGKFVYAIDVTDDGKLLFLAQNSSSPTPYRVTVDMGAARNFGIGAGGDNTAAANNPQPQPTQPQQPAQPQQAQTQPEPQKPDAETKAQQKIDKAKAVGQGLKDLFHHH